MFSIPYQVYRPVEATAIPDLHIQNSKDATVTTIMTMECHTIRTH